MTFSASVHARLLDVAQKDPAACALVVGTEHWTYQRLVSRVEICAAGLRARGVEWGDGVAVALPNSVDFIVAALATFATGGVLVPLNPRFKASEIEQHLQLCAPRAFVHGVELARPLQHVEVPIRAQGMQEFSNAVCVPLPNTGELLTGVYMFSSGSTGKSKRVTRSQQQLVWELEALSDRLCLGPADRVLCTVPLFHAHGFCNAMLAALLSGGALMLQEGEFNPRATLKLLGEHAVTVYPAVPVMFQLMAETLLETPLELTALRWPISAGAHLPQAVAQRFLERFGKSIHQLYGTTETGAISVQSAPVVKPASVGRPLADTQLAIRDEHRAPRAVGEEGEIWVRARSATKAYDGLQEMTARCFDEGWFRTGDLGHLDQDGELFITGRTKLVINVAGFKVDPIEIEEVLKRHPAVADVVVLGVPQGALGERIKAVVVLVAERQCSEQELIAHASVHLADYKLPKSVEFIAAIPRSPLGKVLRKDL